MVPLINREDSVREIWANHYSGDFARTLFQEAFGENSLPAGVGMRIITVG